MLKNEERALDVLEGLYLYVSQLPVLLLLEGPIRVGDQAGSYRALHKTKAQIVR